jgi:hypothetical protein
LATPERDGVLSNPWVTCTTCDVFVRVFVPLGQLHFDDGHVQQARILAADPLSDIGLLKIVPHNVGPGAPPSFPFLNLGKASDLEPGLCFFLPLCLCGASLWLWPWSSGAGSKRAARCCGGVLQVTLCTPSGRHWEENSPCPQERSVCDVHVHFVALFGVLCSVTGMCPSRAHAPHPHPFPLAPLVCCCRCVWV